MRLILSLVFLLCFSVVSTASASNNSNIREALLNQGYSEIPLIIIPHYNKLAVQVSFTNAKNQLFLIDNGAMETSVQPDVVKKLGLIVGHTTIPVIGGGGGLMKFKQAMIPKLQMENFVSHNQTAFFPISRVPRLCNLNYAGTFGSDFLEKHSAIIDVGNKKLYLKSNEVRAAKNQKIKFNGLLTALGYKSVPVKRTESGLQVLMVQVNSFKPERFMLDTGSPSTLISLHLVKKYNLLEQEIGVGKGATGGKMVMYQTNVRNIRVDGKSWAASKPILATDYRDISAGDIPVFGTIGSDWLQDNRAILDIANNSLFIS